MTQFSHMCRALHLILYVELILIQNKKDILYIHESLMWLAITSMGLSRCSFYCLECLTNPNSHVCSTSNRKINVSQPPFAASHSIHMTFVRFSLIFLFHCVSIVNRRACVEETRGCRKKFEINIYVLIIDTLMLEWKEKQFYGAGKGSHV